MIYTKSVINKQGASADQKNTDGAKVQITGYRTQVTGQNEKSLWLCREFVLISFLVQISYLDSSLSTQ